MPTWLLYLLWLGGPSVAWIYALSVWIMYQVFHETTSWKQQLPAVLSRGAWWMAALACCLGISEGLQDVVHWKSVLPLSVLFSIGSIFLCRSTRWKDVVGIQNVPFYGHDHLKGKTAWITGANSGIGKETCLQLARMGAQVYLLCRSRQRAQQAVDDLLQTSSTLKKGQFHIIEMDLGDYQSIRKAIQEHKHVKVDVLINNAGLMMGAATKSKDGHELMMQANHLGHFLLTRLLVQNKQLNNNARIINVTSSTYQFAVKSNYNNNYNYNPNQQPQQAGIDFDDLMCHQGRRPYTLFGQYAQTKLANILFTQELSKRYSSLSSFAVHPGLVRTNVTSNMPWLLRTLNDIFAFYVAQLQKTPQEGAYGSVYCAACPLEKLLLSCPSGSYMVNCQPQALTEAVASNLEDGPRLWKVSEELIGWNDKDHADTTNGS